MLKCIGGVEVSLSSARAVSTITDAADGLELQIVTHTQSLAFPQLRAAALKDTIIARNDATGVQCVHVPQQEAGGAACLRLALPSSRFRPPALPPPPRSPALMLHTAVDAACAADSSWTAERRGINLLVSARLVLNGVPTAKACRARCCSTTGLWCAGIIFFTRGGAGYEAMSCHLLGVSPTADGFQPGGTYPAIAQTLLLGHRHRWHVMPPPPRSPAPSPSPPPRCPSPAPPHPPPPPPPCGGEFIYQRCRATIDCPTGFQCGTPPPWQLAGTWRSACGGGSDGDGGRNGNDDTNTDANADDAWLVMNGVDKPPLVPTACGGCVSARTQAALHLLSIPSRPIPACIATWACALALCMCMGMCMCMGVCHMGMCSRTDASHLSRAGRTSRPLRHRRRLPASPASARARVFVHTSASRRMRGAWMVWRTEELPLLMQWMSHRPRGQIHIQARLLLPWRCSVEWSSRWNWVAPTSPPRLPDRTRKGE